MRLYFRELPRPLLFTPEGRSEGFIDFARECMLQVLFVLLTIAGIEDDTVRRDKMHEAVNDLPDPNYATLRALTLVRETVSYRARLMTTASPTRTGARQL